VDVADVVAGGVDGAARGIQATQSDGKKAHPGNSSNACLVYRHMPAFLEPPGRRTGIARASSCRGGQRARKGFARAAVTGKSSTPYSVATRSMRRMMEISFSAYRGSVA